MSQTAYGQTHALANAVAAFVNSGAELFCTPCVAEVRFAMLTELTDIPKLTEAASVDVIPDIEISERTGGLAPVFASSYAVHVFIQQHVGKGTAEEARCGLLAQLRSEILEGLKRTRFDLATAVRPVNAVFCTGSKNADKGLYDLHRLMQFNVFESDTIVTFRAAV